MNIQRGDIFMTQLGEPKGSIQAGYRPILICSSDINNRHSGILNYIPLTTSKKKKHLPVHVHLHNCGLDQESIALVEQISVINKSDLGKKIGKINEACEKELRKAISIQLGL